MLPCKSKGWDTAAIMFNENDTLSTISTYISFLCVLVSSHNMYHLLICGFFQVQLANHNQPVDRYASKRLKEMPSSESRWVTYLSVDWECIYSLPPEYATWIWIFAFIALSFWYLLQKWLPLQVGICMKLQQWYWEELGPHTTTSCTSASSCALVEMAHYRADILKLAQEVKWWSLVNINNKISANFGRCWGAEFNSFLSDDSLIIFSYFWLLKILLSKKHIYYTELFMQSKWWWYLVDVKENQCFLLCKEKKDLWCFLSFAFANGRWWRCDLILKPWYQ